jgi:hypothetical protein
VKIAKPAITAACETLSPRYNSPINSNDPSHDTVAYKGLVHTMGGSLHKISLKILPIVPVITPMKLAISHRVPTISESFFHYGKKGKAQKEEEWFKQ